MWKAIYSRAGAFLRGEVPNPCNGEPVHTGGLMDRSRAERALWVELDCGDTTTPHGEQKFYAFRGGG